MEAELGEALELTEPVALPPVLVELLTAGVELLTLESGRLSAVDDRVRDELGLLGRDTGAYLADYEFAEYMPGAAPIALDGAGGFFCLDLRAVVAGEAENDGGAPLVWSHAGNLGWDDDAVVPIADDLAQLLLG
ncbi:SMI1/KNR4 family protein [Serinibacter arcticus]|uniref:SMI1/KNR4 family protein n=1 Tax=Serinibacter arcticus TaxID=1655435 RepID=A0A2U1ZZX8_9MICO|nr:SMI1/KNR4 family protein [Serinibacter arcticus]